MLKACQADSRRQRNPTRHNQTAASERHGPQLEGRRYRSRRHWSAEKCAPRRRCSPVERVPEDREQNKGQAMEIERTTFGTITIDGKTYEHEKRSSSSRGDASSSFSAPARWAMCICRRKLRVISRKRAARFYCSPPLRRSACSTDRIRRRSGFFT